MFAWHWAHAPSVEFQTTPAGEHSQPALPVGDVVPRGQARHTSALPAGRYWLAKQFTQVCNVESHTAPAGQVQLALPVIEVDDPGQALQIWSSPAARKVFCAHTVHAWRVSSFHTVPASVHLQPALPAIELDPAGQVEHTSGGSPSAR